MSVKQICAAIPSVPPGMGPIAVVAGVSLCAVSLSAGGLR
jgi:hypothetical protein